jgi:hypothetical protein
MMRQVPGAFMAYESGRLVTRLRGAPAMQAQGDSQEGRRRDITLSRGGSASPSEGQRASGLSYRENRAKLQEVGFRNECGHPFNPQSVRAMIEKPRPAAPGRAAQID